MQILKIIFIILEVVLLFNLLIFVHELGHFLAARWRGLKAERFAIWFGKPIWKKEWKGVEWVLGWIPAGGYVSLPQMAPMEAIEGGSDKPQEKLPQISTLDKIIVAFAGPLFSFLLAVAFALIVVVVGRPVTERETATIIGDVDPGGPADKAGLKAGDKILEIDGKTITKWGGMGSSVMWTIIRSENPSIPIKVQRDEQTLTLAVEPIIQKTKAWERANLRQFLFDAAQTPIINMVVTNGPAHRAGLQRADEIIEINGVKLIHPAGFADYMENNQKVGKLELKVRRPNREARTTNEFMATVLPQVPVGSTNGRVRAGIEWDASGGRMDLAHPGVVEQITSSFDAMVSTFGALFSRKSDIKPQHLSGAVKIMNIYYVLFKSEQGWRLAIWFSVIMNVNLALLNLLPIPVLDGGHITLALIEAVRRKPVSLRILNAVQTSCAMLIIGYMLYIAFYDVQDVLPGDRGRQSVPEMKFAPAGELAPAPAK